MSDDTPPALDLTGLTRQSRWTRWIRLDGVTYAPDPACGLTETDIMVLLRSTRIAVGHGSGWGRR